MKLRLQRGLSFIEILIVVAIIGILTTLILVGVKLAQLKGRDSRIRADVAQLRILAESAYDSQGATYVEWTQLPSIQDALTTQLNDIDAQHGDPLGAPFIATMRESQTTDFCISAPLRSDLNTHYCVDTTGKFVEAAAACPDYGDDFSGDPPLRCPGNE